MFDDLLCNVPQVFLVCLILRKAVMSSTRVSSWFSSHGFMSQVMRYGLHSISEPGRVHDAIAKALRPWKRGES